ncbi:hypothetical protein [Chamaesiphon sp.]|uniref:hypothetical protein n=1 Tax=Chamaesiphon sp. TaxID=2814140 RepID=UPI00359393F3
MSESKLEEYAFPIDRQRDMRTYQLASTRQLFRTVDCVEGGYHLYIFNAGEWQSEGIKTMSEIVDMAANPK